MFDVRGNQAKAREIVRSSAELFMTEEPTLVQFARSPIEKLMAWGLCTRGMWMGKIDSCVFQSADNSIDDLRRECVIRGGLLNLIVGAQMRFGPYTIDFAAAVAIWGQPPLIVVIECDGHEFHTSKDQFTRDKAKDRELLQNGIQVMRFSGSEIWRDAGACAQQIIDHMMKASYVSTVEDESRERFGLEQLYQYEIKEGIASPEWLINEMTPF